MCWLLVSLVAPSKAAVTVTAWEWGSALNQYPCALLLSSCRLVLELMLSVGSRELSGKVSVSPKHCLLCRGWQAHLL